MLRTGDLDPEAARVMCMELDMYNYRASQGNIKMWSANNGTWGKVIVGALIPRILTFILLRSDLFLLAETA